MLLSTIVPSHGCSLMFLDKDLLNRVLETILLLQKL